MGPLSLVSAIFYLEPVHVLGDLWLRYMVIPPYLL